MAVTTMLTMACNGKKTYEHGHDHTEETHEHADGEEHANHADTLSQEEFTVGKDSAATKDAHNHQHESGEEHDH